MKYEINSVNLEVEIKGSGDPILLVHGFPLDHTMWNAQINSLSEHYKVIAPDLRGFGKSDVTPGTVSMEDHADDLMTLLDHLEITTPVHLCGLSMGGYINWQFLRKYPQKIKTLILCDTRAVADTPEGVSNRMNMVENILANGAESIVEPMLGKLVSDNTMKNNVQVVGQLKEMIRNTSPEGMAAALRGMAERPDSTELLEQIEIPALLIVGEEDQLSPPEEMKGLVEKIPGARIEIIRDAGHMAPMEAPDEVNQYILTFLKS